MIKDKRRTTGEGRKKGSSEKKEKTYSVTISYSTDEIDERLRYIASQFGRRLDESTSELLCDELALCVLYSTLQTGVKKANLISNRNG